MQIAISRSCGGQSLHQWCKAQGRNPLDLHIGWYHAATMDNRDEENRIFDDLKPRLNKRRPPRRR